MKTLLTPHGVARLAITVFNTLKRQQEEEHSTADIATAIVDAVGEVLLCVPGAVVMKEDEEMTEGERLTAGLLEFRAAAHDIIERTFSAARGEDGG